MELSATLLQAQSADVEARWAAERQLKVWEEQSLPQFMLALALELAGENMRATSRQLAGLHLKNMISARDAKTAAAKRARYFAYVDAATRSQLKAICLEVLRSPTVQAAQTGAQVVAKMGALELQEKQWPELLENLLMNMAAIDVADPSVLKTATLETLGYICEELDEDVINQEETNKILTAIVDGMRENHCDNVRVAAANALLNSLVFTRHNFDNEAERNMIMQVVCGASKSTNEKLRVIAFESLARVASLYYDKLPQYIETIFSLTLLAIQQDKEERVCMMAIEFWSTLCEEEIEILEEIDDHPTGDKERKCAQYVHYAAAHLVPVLLNFTLTKQDEDADEDTWNISAAGAVCLGLISQTIGDACVPTVLGFVEVNILHPEWRRREASIMAFGQILDGPKAETMAVHVQTVMSVLVRSLGDENPLVRDTTAWTIARICELHAQRIPSEYLNPLVERLIAALRDTSRVAAQACFAVHNLAQAIEHGPQRETNALSPFCHSLLRQLLDVTERRDWQDHNLRGQAYEAVNMLVQNHATDTRPVVVEVMQLILQRLQATFSMQLVSQDDREERDQLQSLLCSVVQVIARGIDKEVSPFSDHIMGLLLQVINNQNAVASEEAFMAIGALASIIDSAFEKYMPDLFPFLMKGLRNYAEWQVCSAAVGTAGDICRALEIRILPYCDDIVRCLLENLQSPELSRAVKPGVLSCFGDLCLAIGGNFEKYLPLTLQMLEQAARTKVSEDDEELVEYLGVLREGILEAYTGIIQGLHDGNKITLLLPHLSGIFCFLQLTIDDSKRGLCEDQESLTKSVIGIIGDLAASIATSGEVSPFFREPFICNLLDESKKNPSLSDICAWTLSKVSLHG